MTVGLLSSTVMAALWGYLDIYRATIQKQRVAYETARSTTHAILACIGITLIRWVQMAPLFITHQSVTSTSHKPPVDHIHS